MPVDTASRESRDAYDTIIIGGGPAGLSGALVLGRCVRSVLVCDSGRYRNERSHALHCYMGSDGIAPAALLEQGRLQLEPYEKVSLTRKQVIDVASADEAFRVDLADGAAVFGRSLLVATGVVDEVPRIDGIDELYGRSVHVCPYCDGWAHRNGPVAVYGRGEKAAGFALLLRQWTDDLVLLTDGPASLTQEERGRLSRRGIRVREEPISKLEGIDGRLQTIHFTQGTPLPRQAFFFTTGQHPRSPLLQKLGCRYTEGGGVTCDENGETSIPGVYVAGDASRDVQLAIIAAAEGARAALAINKRLLQVDGHL